MVRCEHREDGRFLWGRSVRGEVLRRRPQQRAHSGRSVRCHQVDAHGVRRDGEIARLAEKRLQHDGLVHEVHCVQVRIVAVAGDYVGRVNARLLGRRAVLTASSLLDIEVSSHPTHDCRAYEDGRLIGMVHVGA